MAQVVDYSFARPAPAAIVGAGYVGALRYLSGGGSKDLTVAERNALHGAGLSIGLVWETTADRAGQGFAAGQRDGQRANVQADSLGWPGTRPLYYAVDFQAVWGQVAAYFDGVRSVGGRPIGVYGCYDVIEGAARAGFSYLWQCAAWSGSGSGSGGSLQSRRLSQFSSLFQRVGYVLNNTCDVNDVLKADWGGWNPNNAPDPSEEDLMSEATPYFQRTSDGHPHLIFPLAGTRVDFATMDGVTGDKQVAAIKYVSALGGNPHPIIEKPQITDPNADFFITRSYREIADPHTVQALTKMILDAIKAIPGGEDVDATPEAIAAAVLDAIQAQFNKP